MKRPVRVSTGSALLALLLVLPSAAQEIAPAAPVPPFLLVPAGAAPALDGRVGEEEWKGSAAFTVKRGADVFGRGWLRRTGRQLYFAFDSPLSPWGLGLRLTFTDPVSGRGNLVLVTPVNPPVSPLAAFRQLVGRDVEPVSASASPGATASRARRGSRSTSSRSSRRTRTTRSPSRYGDSKRTARWRSTRRRSARPRPT